MVFRYENEFSAPYAHLNYPGFPNMVGMTYINLVKGEFMANQTYKIESDAKTQYFYPRMTFGLHKISIEDSNGAILWSEEVKVEPSDKCDFLKNGRSFIENGNFDKGEASKDLVYPAPVLIHWDGYVKDGLKIRPRSPHFLTIPLDKVLRRVP